MKIVDRNVTVIALFVSTLFLAACSAGSEEEPIAQEAGSVQQSESPTSDQILLAETYTFPGFGFSIDYPAGWSAETRDTVTVIAELKSDLSTAFQDNGPPDEGAGISLDQRTLAYMRGIGLGEEPTLEDLFDLNKSFFQWQEPVEPQEAEAFDSPALAVSTSNDEAWSHTLMGYANDRAFLLQISAPSEEKLDDLMPTWEQILASIQPVEE